MVVATYRSDELHRRHPLRPVLAELDRSGRVERHELARLSRTELAELVTAIRGVEPDAELVDEILTRSEGNAFFAEELLAAGAAGSVPASHVALSSCSRGSSMCLFDGTRVWCCKWPR